MLNAHDNVSLSYQSISVSVSGDKSEHSNNRILFIPFYTDYLIKNNMVACSYC